MTVVREGTFPQSRPQKMMPPQASATVSESCFWVSLHEVLGLGHVFHPEVYITLSVTVEIFILKQFRPCRKHLSSSLIHFSCFHF